MNLSFLPSNDVGKLYNALCNKGYDNQKGYSRNIFYMTKGEATSFFSSPEPKAHQVSL